MHLTDLLPTFVAAAGGKRRSRLARRRDQPAGGLDRQGGRRPNAPCSGNGGARAPTNWPRCEANSSWSSPAGESPSCTTSWATPPSAATFPPSIRS